MRTTASGRFCNSVSSVRLRCGSGSIGVSLFGFLRGTGGMFLPYVVIRTDGLRSVSRKRRSRESAEGAPDSNKRLDPGEERVQANEQRLQRQRRVEVERLRAAEGLAHEIDRVLGRGQAIERSVGAQLGGGVGMNQHTVGAEARAKAE